MATLYVVGTPIGNPEDMSIRALNYLKEAKNIIAENPPMLQILLDSLGLDKSDANIMYNHSWPKWIGEEPIIPEAMRLLKSGEDVYVVCDGGMPGISDPGGLLVSECIKEGIKISVTPGPSIVACASVITGCGAFMFAEFIPKQDAYRKIVLKRFANNPVPNLCLLINDKDYFVSVMKDMIQIWGDRKGALCYNLTTSKEYVTYGRLSELRDYWLNHYMPDSEVCLVVDGLLRTLPVPNF
jgi:16S rRNA (cytidine1402-2'-O)-methyltransferase